MVVVYFASRMSLGVMVKMSECLWKWFLRETKELLVWMILEAVI